MVIDFYGHFVEFRDSGAARTHELEIEFGVPIPVEGKILDDGGRGRAVRSLIFEFHFGNVHERFRIIVRVIDHQPADRLEIVPFELDLRSAALGGILFREVESPDI